MRCIAVLGPSGSGKTTLVEKLGALEGEAATTETRHGFRLSRFVWSSEPWAALDTPGDIEALPQIAAALAACDAAVICVPPDPEAAVLVAPYLEAVETSHTPFFIFINAIDKAQGRVRDVVAALQDYASHVIVLRQIPIRSGDGVIGAVDLISERAWKYREGGPSALIPLPADLTDREHEARAELLEHLSEYDDWLLEELIEDREPDHAPVYSIAARTLRDNRLAPALIGSAAHGAGVTRLMKALRHETPGVDALRARLAEGAAREGETARVPRAVAFHADIRPHVGKTVYLRALDDGLAQGGRLGGGKIGALTEIGGEGGAISGPLETGGIAAAVKSDQLRAGTVLDEDGALRPPARRPRPRPPMLARVISAAHEKDEARLAGAAARLAETDPGLVVAREEGTGRLMFRTQGPMHLAALRRRLSEDFGVETEEERPAPVYRETIAGTADVHHRHRKQTGGAGQFADIRLSVAPNPRGAGFTFDETVKGGAVPRNYIPSVEAGARDALEKGPLGFPVDDVSATLTDGQHHSVDSSDFAFRTAARAAMREALGQAAPVLLQPICAVELHAPSVNGGALSGIVASLRGQVLGFDRDPRAKGWDVFRALIPGAALEELERALRAATHGVGWFSAEFDHYEELYGKEADRVVSVQAQD